MGIPQERNQSCSEQAMSPSGVVFIDVHTALTDFAKGQEHLRAMPEDLYEWRDSVRSLIDPDAHTELFGGYNNLVVRENEGLTIFWRQSSTRWLDIIRAALLEHHMSKTFAVPGRELRFPSTPVSITEQGLLATQTTYIHGENRYPWNQDEIASAASMLGNLHEAMRNVTFDPRITQPATKDNQLLHGDFARGNVLFEHGKSDVAGVIDYERATEGPIEQDLGKTLSLLLVDTKIPETDWMRNPTFGDYEKTTGLFWERLQLWLEQYPQNVDTVEVSLWAELYLKNDDFGDLNHVRDMAMTWLREAILSN